MKCSKCGYENDSQSNYCMNCGTSLVQQESLYESDNISGSGGLSNIANNVQNDEYLYKCPKCGYPNQISEQNCKNCEFALNGENVILVKENDSQINNDNVEVNKKKNIFMFIIFSIMYSITPFLIMVFINILDNNFKSMMSFILFLILLLLQFFGIEPLTCLTVKKIVKNTKYMKKELVILEIILISLFSIIVFAAGVKFNILIIVFIIIRILMWFITRKIFIKDKITINKKIIAVLVTYISLLFIIPNVILPTKLNKTLFNVFGSTEFSSKGFQTELIDAYNIYNDTNNSFSYFHKFTDKELNEITEIYVEEEFTNEDIKRLKNLKKLSILKKIKFNKTIDLTGNKKLTYLSISSSDIKNVKLPDSINQFFCESTLDELDISNLKYLSELEIKVNKLKVENLDQLEKITYLDDVSFNTLYVNDKKFGLKNGYISSESNHYRGNYLIYVPEYTKVSDFTFNNLKIKVLSWIYNEERTTDDELENNDKISIYDNDGNLLITLEVNVRRNY